MEESFILIVNAVLYLVLLIVSIIRKRGKMGIMLTGIYAFLSLCCAFFFYKSYYNLNRYLWPYLYFFVIFVILLKPFQRKDSILDKVKINNTVLLNKVFDVFIIISILYILVFSGKVISAVRSGRWLSVYLSMRGEDAVFYNNFFERILINVVSYFRIPAVFYAFYVFARNIEYKRKTILLITPLVTSFMWAILTASRSSILDIGILYIMCFVICMNDVSNSFRRGFITFLSVFGVVATFFILAVNVSRFGEGDSDWTSAYFGHSFIVAHNTIAYTDRIGYGKNFWGTVYNMLHIQVAPYHCQIDDGVAFHPLISMRYSDYGLIGTVIYAIIVSIFFNRLLKKRRMSIGEVYIVLYFYVSLFIGAFYDNANSLSWMIVIVVSLLLNTLSKYTVTAKT